MAFHHESGPGDAHAIHSLAKRDSHEPSEGSTDPITSEDVALHRICFVKVPAGFYYLSNFSPLAWSPLGTGGSAPGLYRQEQLVYTDVVNKVVGPLSEVPATPEEVTLVPIGGPPQDYGLDYTVREVVGGASPGWYLCVDPLSTAPGGGSFGSGSNPTVGIADLLSSGDVVQVTYTVNP
jgi:hypothetical protein